MTTTRTAVSRAALLILAVVFGTLTLTGCSTGAVSTTTAQEWLKAATQPGVVIVDVRTPAEYAAGHLEGAVLADINGDFEAAVAGLDRAAPYAVYCRSGSRSAAAIEAMKQLGFGDAWHLGGGIGAWQSAGLPVVS